MGEIKSVKVDNWGVFFLQKLQNFFNKTDYCDLTLQFRDNSQLKVHRLVLSACTDYFNVLEQKCEVVDDAIIMPSGLQADVVVPIVNFMYTGTLEFELKMYNRLLRTAKDMNMTVLLKLLEAHRRTMEMHPQKNQMPTSPKLRRKPVPSNTVGAPVSTAGRSLIQPQQQRRIVVAGNSPQQPQQQQRNVPSNTYARVTSTSMTATSLIPVKQQIGSTTFTRIKQEPEQDENVSGGYTLLKKTTQQQQHIVTSPFEQLRKGYNNNKRPAATTFISPPAKKPNLEDVKEFAEQQRMRKQIAAEFGDDGDYDTGIMDDDTIHNDDDDDDMAAGSSAPSSTSAAVQTSTTQQQSDDPPGTTTIIVKHEGPDKPPTIVVKDSSNSKMNHAKIISEVLRQYPHLVNSNKNIKLKIMPNAGGQTQKIIVKKEPAEPEKPATVASAPVAIGQRLSAMPKLEEGKLLPAASSVVANKPKPQSTQSGNTSANMVVVGSTTTQQSAATSTPSAVPPQKRRIDSKTMHALIALGAENTTGPWLCLRCGRNGHPISIPSYRGFRRHLINTHKETIDPSLCEHCGWRSASKRELHFHMQMDHKVKTNLYIFPDCQLCQQMCIDSDALNQHLIDSHPDENKQQCIYCNKIFPEELQLYTHMKTFHKKQALEDGIIDYSDDENTNTDLVYPPPLGEHEMEVDHPPQQQEQKKIKILSDISLPIASSIIKTDTFAGSTDHGLTTGESTTSVASEEYLHEHQEHVETKFVAADGSEVILTDAQRKEILSQLNQENEGSGVVMVLNESQHYAGGETQSEQGVISHDETSQATTATNDEHEEHDDSQIYNELKPQTQQAAVEEDVTSQAEPETTGNNEQEDEEEVEQTEEPEKNERVHHDAALDESKESTDNLEWAENLISEHDMADDIPESTAATRAIPQEVNKEEESKDGEDYKSQEDISKKLKELAGDWSEDDEDDEEMLEEPTTQKIDEIEEVSKKENVETEEAEEVVDHETPEEEVEQETAEPEKVLETTENKAETTETENTTEEDFISKSVQETKKEEKDIKEPVEEDAEAMIEDDVDLALKSMHKENDDDEDSSKENKGDEKVEQKKSQTNESIAISTDIKENEGIVPETTITKINDDGKDSDKKSEIPKEEVNISHDECKASTLSEDEETKKDLIDMLLSEHVATVVDTKVETIDDLKSETGDDSKTEPIKETVKETAADIQEVIKADNFEEIVNEGEVSATTESSAQGPLQEDEFLDVTPEKVVENKDDLSAAASSSAGPEAPESPREIAKDAVTSEDRVKNLISEWGDDEDEDENEDADLKANL